MTIVLLLICLLLILWVDLAILLPWVDMPTYSEDPALSQCMNWLTHITTPFLNNRTITLAKERPMGTNVERDYTLITI